MIDLENMTEEELDELMKSVNGLPPISGNMIQDYSTLLLKEIALLTELWEKSYSRVTVESNPLILNHKAQIASTYRKLMSVTEDVNTIRKNPKIDINELLKKYEKDGIIKTEGGGN